MALAASVLGMIVLGVAVGVYLGSAARTARRATTERVVTQAIDEATLLRGQANGDRQMARGPRCGEEGSLYPGCGRAVNRYCRTKWYGCREPLSEQAEATRRQAELDRDRRFIERLEEICFGEAEKSPWSSLRPIDDAYANAFREFGIDLDRIDPAQAGRLLSQRSEPLEMAFFLSTIGRWCVVWHGTKKMRAPGND